MQSFEEKLMEVFKSVLDSPEGEPENLFVDAEKFYVEERARTAVERIARLIDELKGEMNLLLELYSTLYRNQELYRESKATLKGALHWLIDMSMQIGSDKYLIEMPVRYIRSYFDVRGNCAERDFHEWIHQRLLYYSQSSFISTLSEEISGMLLSFDKKVHQIFYITQSILSQGEILKQTSWGVAKFREIFRGCCIVEMKDKFGEITKVPIVCGKFQEADHACVLKDEAFRESILKIYAVINHIELNKL